VSAEAEGNWPHDLVEGVADASVQESGCVLPEADGATSSGVSAGRTTASKPRYERPAQQWRPSASSHQPTSFTALTARLDERWTLRIGFREHPSRRRVKGDRPELSRLALASAGFAP